MHANGASFDCKKASSSIEKAICSNQELGVLDERLSESYKQSRTTFSPEFFKKYVQKDQVNWLKGLKSTCTVNFDKCLIGEFQKRIKFLADSSLKNKGYLIFNGKIDSTDLFIKKINEKGSVTILSEDLFLAEYEDVQPSEAQSPTPRCERSNSYFRKSDGKQLLNKDLFILSNAKQLSLELANILLKDKDNKDRVQNKADLISDLEAKVNDELSEITITKEYIKFDHVLSRSSECAYVSMQVSTKAFVNFLTPYLRKQLGL